MVGTCAISGRGIFLDVDTWRRTDTLGVRPQWMRFCRMDMGCNCMTGQYVGVVRGLVCASDYHTDGDARSNPLGPANGEGAELMQRRIVSLPRVLLQPVSCCRPEQQYTR